MTKSLEELTKRVMTHAGDSTDGEEQSREHNFYVKSHKAYIAALNNKLASVLLEHKASFLLKDVASRLLQHPAVRSKYIEMKINMQGEINDNSISSNIGKNFVTAALKGLDEVSKQLTDEHTAASFYRDNKNLIDSVFAADGKFKQAAQEYNTIQTEAEKSNLYLKQTEIKRYIERAKDYLDIRKLDSTIDKNYISTYIREYPKYKAQDSDKITKAYFLNKKVFEYAKANRTQYKLPVKKYAEDQLNLNDQDNDAVEFLATLRLNKKLDRDIGKVRLIGALHSDSKDKMGESSQDKTSLSITPQKKTFSHLNFDEGTYKEISKRLELYSKTNKISNKENTKGEKQGKFKDIFKSIIKNGKMADGLITEYDSIAKQTIEDKLLTDAALIFGLEGQRNSAALLTTAMFFDLVDKRVYKITDMPEKMPMAMKSAVKASSYIDHKYQQNFTSLLKYDYRPSDQSSGTLTKTQGLSARDTNILNDWLSSNKFENAIGYAKFKYNVFNKLICDWYGAKLNLPYLSDADSFEKSADNSLCESTYDNTDSASDDYQSENFERHFGDSGYETDGTNAEQQAIYEAFEYADSETNSSDAEDDVTIMGNYDSDHSIDQI